MDDEKPAGMIQQPTTAEREERRQLAQAALEASRERAVRNNRLFLNAWKRGVELAGAQYFTCRPPFGETLKPASSVAEASDRDQLAPDAEFIIETIGVLSSGQRKFLAAMCSFYNAQWGGYLLREQGVNGLADLSATLDAEHRQVIADLLVSYAGW